MSHRLVLASANAGKLQELQILLAPLAIEVLSQRDFGIDAIEETGLTFVENALLKARHASRIAGLPALADDSGLAVDALGGAPGLYSARYAGPKASDAANNQRLLTELAQVPPEQRRAHYICVLALVRHPADQVPLICQARWHGQILMAPKGQGGFGYDPLFLLPELGQSAAELDPAHKNRLSHRGQAMQMLLAELPDFLGQA